MSYEQNLLQRQELHRNQIWPKTFQLHYILNVLVLP